MEKETNFYSTGLKIFKNCPAWRLRRRVISLRIMALLITIAACLSALVSTVYAGQYYNGGDSFSYYKNGTWCKDHDYNQYVFPGDSTDRYYLQSCTRNYWWDGCSELNIGTKIEDFTSSCITDCIRGGTFSYCNYSTTQYQVYEVCNGTDADGDGHYTLDSCKTPHDDCNDGDATIYPGAEELCDCKDNDCDDTIDEGCCPKITDFKGNNTEINRSTGGNIKFEGTIQTVCDKPVSWTLSVPGKTFAGSGTSVSVTWDGKDSSGKVVKPGTYNATLSATANNCTKTESKSFTVKELENCNLGVTFKSKVNIASGNLSHSQELFRTKGGALPASMSLHYNSLDPYDGPLGMGWIHNYDIAVEENESGSVVLRDGAGGYRLYTQSADRYASQPGDYSVLSKNADGAYTITYKDGLKHTFGTNGKINSIVDRNGNTATFAYDNGNLTSITDPAGRLTTLSYDSSNRITAIIDPIGNTHSFTYSGNDLIQVSISNLQLETKTWTYSYYDDSFLLTKTDPNGNATTYTYDTEHRILTGTDSEGQSKGMAYAGSDTKTATVTETDGGVWQYSYDAEAGTLSTKSIRRATQQPMRTMETETCSARPILTVRPPPMLTTAAGI